MTLKAPNLGNFDWNIYIRFYPKTAKGKKNIENWLCFVEIVRRENGINYRLVW